MKNFLYCLFAWLPLIVSAAVCPNHYQLLSDAKYDTIVYTESHAEMSFQVKFNGAKRRLSFILPARPPFARNKSDGYVSDTKAWDRGNINWGMTERYKLDYADVLLNYIAFRNAYDHSGRIDCLYLSILENNYLYGHIWIDKPD